MFTYLKNMYLKLIRIVGIYIISLIYVPLNLLHRSIHYTSEAAVQSISPTILGTSPAFPAQPRCVWIRCSISWTYSCTGRPCGSLDDPRRVSRPLPFCHPSAFQPAAWPWGNCRLPASSARQLSSRRQGVRQIESDMKTHPPVLWAY